MSIQTVCVYCGSSSHVDDSYKETAHQVGTALARRRMRVVYGGGHVGLMGILADSALKAGGEVVGIIPEHIRAREVQHDHLTELHVVDSMHTRKRMMVERSDAFVILPGGIGTLDETFEILSWRQLGLHTKPVVIFNKDGFWDSLIDLMDHLVAHGFAPRENYLSYKVAHDVDEMFTALMTPVAPGPDLAAKWM